MHETISRYIKGCTMCGTSKPSNRKLGLYTPLPVPSRPWESVSMDFVGDCKNIENVMTICMLLWIGSVKCVF